MRSPDSRVVLEWGLRLGAVAALVLAWRDASRPHAARTHRLEAPALVRRLEALPLDDSVIVASDTALSPAWRDLLAARRDAGASVRWSGAIDPVAVTLDRVPDPSARVALSMTAPAGRVVTVRDSLGPVDSVSMPAGATRLTFASPLGAVAVRIGTSHVPLTPPPPDTLREVLLLARAGWEAKFVAAALEEAGWRVALRLSVRPDTATVQGAARIVAHGVDVVIALDARAAAAAPAIARFARDGGGVILGPDALASGAFGAIAPGIGGARRPPGTLTIDTVAPRRALPVIPITRLDRDAVPLERDGSAIVVAARRVERGRVIAVGVEDSWRWRMAGPDGSVEAHRRWWSSLVAAARGPGNLSDALRVNSFAAPRVAMIAALGPPDPGAARVVRAPAPDPPRWRWPLVAIGALLAEWGSRRLRGAR